MSIKTIILPISNLINTDAIYYAKKMALENDAKLIVVYITSPLSFTNHYNYPSMLYSLAYLNMESVNLVHDHVTQKLTFFLEGCPHEIICVVGTKTDTLLQIAKEKSADLIILPEHGANLLSKFILNPSKHALEKKSHIPVIEYVSSKTE
ncbi:MAG: universal stress protein [Cellulosilyticaceae bacterium]